MNEKGIGNCEHVILVKDGTVLLFNDDDEHYAQEFNCLQEIDNFIAELRVKAREVFPEKSDINARDELGLQRPILITQLIKNAEHVLDEKGDMPVYVELTDLGYDDNVTMSSPFSFSCIEIADKYHDMVKMWPELEGKPVYKIG